MNTTRHKTSTHLHPVQRSAYQAEIYIAWGIITVLFLAIALELFPRRLVAEITSTVGVVVICAFYFFHFYRENQNLYLKEQRAKAKLLAHIKQQYPYFNEWEKALNDLIDQQLATGSCPRTRLAMIYHYRHNPTALHQLTQALRQEDEGVQVLKDLGVSWQPKSSCYSRSNHR